MLINLVVYILAGTFSDATNLSDDLAECLGRMLCMELFDTEQGGGRTGKAAVNGTH